MLEERSAGKEGPNGTSLDLSKNPDPRFRKTALASPDSRLLGQEVLEPLLEAQNLAMPQIEERLLLRQLRLHNFRLQGPTGGGALQLQDGASPEVQVLQAHTKN